MRILIVKVHHDPEHERYTWMVAYMLPFTPVGACNYGAEGDVVSLQLTIPHTAREAKAQNIFTQHVEKAAADMGKHVHITVRKPEDIVACGSPGMSLSWMTDHHEKGE